MEYGTAKIASNLPGAPDPLETFMLSCAQSRLTKGGKVPPLPSIQEALPSLQEMREEMERQLVGNKKDWKLVFLMPLASAAVILSIKGGIWLSSVITPRVGGYLAALAAGSFMIAGVVAILKAWRTRS